MALYAQQIDVADPQHVRIGAAVGNVAGTASLDFYRCVLEDIRPLLVGVAGEANRILRRGGPHLFGSGRPVRIMAIGALDQALIDTMMERHFELGLLLGVAGVAKLGLRLGQQKLLALRVVRRMAGSAADLVLCMDGVDGIHVLRATRVACQTAVVHFFRRGFCKPEYFRLIAAARHVVRPRPVTALATLVRRPAFCIQRRLPVRRLGPIVVELFVAGFARVGAYILRIVRRRCSLCRTPLITGRLKFVFSSRLLGSCHR